MLTKSVASLNEGLKADFETYMQVVKREEESKKDVITADAYSMLKQAAKELRSVDYAINRCVQSGMNNYTKLKITSRVEINQ